MTRHIWTTLGFLVLVGCGSQSDTPSPTQPPSTPISVASLIPAIWRADTTIVSGFAKARLNFNLTLTRSATSDSVGQFQSKLNMDSIVGQPVIGDVRTESGQWRLTNNTIIITTTDCQQSSLSAFPAAKDSVPFQMSKDGKFIANALTSVTCPAPDTLTSLPKDSDWRISRRVLLPGQAPSTWTLTFRRSNP